MRLYKDGLVKELTKEKTVNRFLREGWTADLAPVAPVEIAPLDREISEPPKRRGRPAKVTNGND